MMIKKLETLIQEYPKFFRDPNIKYPGELEMPFTLFGFECGDGWYLILKRLFGWLKWNIEQNDYPAILIDQVKEKYGGLRFEYTTIPYIEHNWKDTRADWDEERKEKWFYVHEREIRGAVSYAESLSYHICERCGSTEDVTSGGKSWITTRCAICRKEAEACLT